MPRLFPLVAATLLAPVALASVAWSAEDPIAARKALMDGNGAAAGLAGAMLKGEVPYSPAAGLAVLANFAAVGATFGDYFPEGSNTGDTTAAPKVWEDRAGFDAELARFAEAAVAGLAAAGEDGPADLDAFKAAAQSVLGTCRDCHEEFRIRR